MLIKLGSIILVATFGIVAVLIAMWLVGTVGGIGGGLIHLLLVLVILLAPLGGGVGVILLVLGLIQRGRGH